MALRKSPEEKQQRDAERQQEGANRQAAKAAEATRRAQAEAEKEFWVSPQGQARQTKVAGLSWFQIQLGIQETYKSFLTVLSKAREIQGAAAAIEAIESEGFELFQAGFYYQVTGQSSVDKVMSHGQTIGVSGSARGVYLFKATGVGPRNDTPWTHV
jgi:GH24 family phage-related lysozyme (muramidase)